MRVLKRDGTLENVSFDKVLQRIRKAAKGLAINPDALAQEVLTQLCDKVQTTQLDELTARLAACLITNHPDWGVLSASIAISNHHKKTSASFCEVMKLLGKQVHKKTGKEISYINQEVIDICNDPVLGPLIDNAIDHSRDYSIDYFGFKTLENSYLLKDSDGIVRERPQFIWMRVALGLWGRNFPRVSETYELLSKKKFTHATPTLFAAGTPRQQLSSCFLVAMKADSISGIFQTLADCADISQGAGGIGLSCHDIRARGSLIKGTNGTSNGLVPMLRVFNNTARYVDQGGGKRNGSFAVYLEPWHADVEDFLRLKLNAGAAEDRARDLFYALWISDLFMERVEMDAEWSLFCPDEAPGLAHVWGKEHRDLYLRYEAEGRQKRSVSARKLWYQILDTQMETGSPYLLYKDQANAKSNQQNLGTIMSSNLCTEIIEFSSPDETAVCNLASLSLPSFIHDGVFNYEELRAVVKVCIRNLNRVIDVNYYPTKEAKNSNMRHRPVGLGVQGLADVFAILKINWESEEAARVNKLIFEHMYYASVETSAEIADTEGAYSTFEGSPISKGILQPDMWNVIPLTQTSGELDWASLRERVKKGVRNSLLIAPMPTASTSQILGNNECFEPFTTNIYSRRTLAGEFTVINKYLLKELIDLGLWSESLKQKIVQQLGSVQGIEQIPAEIQERYKTSWELSQKVLIDMAAGRGAFICQSQSLNLFVKDPTYAKLTSMHFYGWKAGLKTGCYYLRTKAPVMAQQFTVEPRLLAAASSCEGAADAADDDDDDESVSTVDAEEAEAVAVAAAAKKKEERKALLEKLSAEYEASVEKAKEDAASGEGCLMCSG